MSASIKSSTSSTNQKRIVVLNGDEYDSQALIQAIQTAAGTRATATYEETIAPYAASADTKTS